jgi:hypothetical protein
MFELSWNPFKKSKNRASASTIGNII